MVVIRLLHSVGRSLPSIRDIRRLGSLQLPIENLACFELSRSIMRLSLVICLHTLTSLHKAANDILLGPSLSRSRTRPQPTRGTQQMLLKLG